VCSDPQSTPVWGDGNDLGWDWSQAQYDETALNGQLKVNTYFPETDTTSIHGELYGANWIEVKVVPVPAALWLFVSGLLGVIGLARRRPGY
jgi:hypothetical protein